MNRLVARISPGEMHSLAPHNDLFERKATRLSDIVLMDQTKTVPAAA